MLKVSPLGIQHRNRIYTIFTMLHVIKELQPIMPPEKIEPISEKDGQIVFNLCSDAANLDWIRAARLKKKAADEGDEKAAAELAELENTPVYKCSWEEWNKMLYDLSP
jgi:hypothetical protein